MTRVSKNRPDATGILPFAEDHEQDMFYSFPMHSRTEMPTHGPLGGSKEKENFWNQKLVEELHRIGVPSAGFERIFTVRKEGKDVQSKPDVSLSNGGVHIVSAKFGARRELEAYTSADEYKEILGPTLSRQGERLGEVFAVTYQATKTEKFHLHVLPRGGHSEISLTLDSLAEVAQHVKNTIEGLREELKRREEPVLEEARRLLRWGAEDIASSIEGITLAELEAIYGGHDFFHSVLQRRLKKERRAETLRLGAAYLFVNQVLFYVLLSQAAKRAGEQGLYPPISREQFGSPQVLRDQYFERVHLKNYEPIYGVNVAQFFRGDGAREASEEVVRGIVGLAPKMDVPDLVGQVFQTLIPFQIRKPLGAHYTNPRAARLLATLAIGRPDAKVMDPACGSGTLLVAAYRRKMALASPRDRRDLHTQFMERDITGIDAMAFAAHLAAVNLALQEPLLETDHVRVGVRDSTRLHPGAEIEHTEDALASELRTATLDHDFTVKKKATRRSGPVKLRAGTTRAFLLEEPDLIMMNPPFTRWSTMAKEYRDAVRLGFSSEKAEFRQVITKRPGQHLFFLLLADRFLKTGGFASVLPQATFKEAAYQRLDQFLLRTYTIRFIVVGFGLASFSEDTSLTECLVVAEKRAPPPNSTFSLIGTYKPPNEWTADEIERLAERVLSGEEGQDEFAIIRHCPQKALAPEAETLTGLYLRLLDGYKKAIEDLDECASEAILPLVPFSQLAQRLDVDVGRGIETSEHFSHYGPKALLGFRRGEGMGEVDRLTYKGGVGGDVVFRDRIGDKAYRIPASAVRPALRALSDHNTMNITGKTDFCIARLTPEARKAMIDLYGTDDARKYLGRVKRRWTKRVAESSSRLFLFRRGDLSAPGTRLICFWSEEPALQAGTNYIFKGLNDTTIEKFLCLWLNSSPSLVWLLTEASITRGAYVTLEKFGAYKLRLPDFSKLTGDQRRVIETEFARLGTAEFPSLLDQLEGHHPARVALDDVCLKLVGIGNAEEREEVAERLRTGAAEAIRALKRTMDGRPPADAEVELEAEPEEEEHETE